MVFADASAVVTAYLADERDHPRFRTLLLEAQEPTLVSDIARVEFAAAVSAAARAGRIREPAAFIARFERDCALGRRFRVLALRPGPVLGRARELVTAHRLRTLDAIHLAVALIDARRVALDEPLAFATRDDAQAHAARALGLAVA